MTNSRHSHSFCLYCVTSCFGCIYKQHHSVWMWFCDEEYKKILKIGNICSYSTNSCFIFIYANVLFHLYMYMDHGFLLSGIHIRLDRKEPRLLLWIVTLYTTDIQTVDDIIKYVNYRFTRPRQFLQGSGFASGRNCKHSLMSLASFYLHSLHRNTSLPFVHNTAFIKAMHWLLNPSGARLGYWREISQYHGCRLPGPLRRRSPTAMVLTLTFTRVPHIHEESFLLPFS